MDDEGVEKGALRGKHKGGLKLTVAQTGNPQEISSTLHKGTTGKQSYMDGDRISRSQAGCPY